MKFEQAAAGWPSGCPRFWPRGGKGGRRLLARRAQRSDPMERGSVVIIRAPQPAGGEEPVCNRRIRLAQVWEGEVNSSSSGGRIAATGRNSSRSAGWLWAGQVCARPQDVLGHRRGAALPSTVFATGTGRCGHDRARSRGWFRCTSYATLPMCWSGRVGHPWLVFETVIQIPRTASFTQVGRRHALRRALETCTWVDRLLKAADRKNFEWGAKSTAGHGWAKGSGRLWRHRKFFLTGQL